MVKNISLCLFAVGLRSPPDQFQLAQPKMFCDGAIVLVPVAARTDDDQIECHQEQPLFVAATSRATLQMHFFNGEQLYNQIRC